jgi:hypothetical protein
VSPVPSPRRHPIATTEFPKAQSVRETAGEPAALAHVRLERRLPVAGHARRRVPVHRCAPECVEDNDSQRPTILRLRRRPSIRSESMGRQAPPALEGGRR